MAVALAQAGCDIVGVSIKPADLTATAVQGMGRRFRHIATDLSAAVAEEVVARATAAFGRIDILVNNAGIIRRANTLEFAERDWDDVIAVNLKAVFFLSQAAARQFIRQQTAGEMTGAGSSTSPRCCPFRAASAWRPTLRPRAVCSGSLGCSPTSGRNTGSP
jgi:2-deoxy-D-gluconate 3-dehydrogenase